MYLDISLPSRGSTNILDLIKSCYSLLKDRSIPMPQFSVTSNQPSLMNGGKDFCEWSKHDREIAASAGKIACAFLGKYGTGLVDAALAESFFEKGGDPYEIISLVSKAKLEAETVGKLELCFAANAVLIRQHLVSGNPDAAKSVLDSFEKVAKRDGLKRLLPTIEAMRCYIAADELDKAFSLIESTRFYAEKCDRKFIAMELSILTTIIMYRRGSAWQENFVKALEKICEYRFVPIISREEAAVFPLFEECRETCCADRKINRKWFDAVFDAVGKMSRRYPLYLK